PHHLTHYKHASSPAHPSTLTTSDLQKPQPQWLITSTDLRVKRTGLPNSRPCKMPLQTSRLRRLHRSTALTSMLTTKTCQHLAMISTICSTTKLELTKELTLVMG